MLHALRDGAGAHARGARRVAAPRPRAGTNSYVLFTLDKLIMKVVKQMQVLLNDDLAAVRAARRRPARPPTGRTVWRSAYRAMVFCIPRRVRALANTCCL